MAQAQVPLIVLSGREDDVELVNRSLRDGGHPVRCHWVAKVDALAERDRGACARAPVLLPRQPAGTDPRRSPRSSSTPPARCRSSSSARPRKETDIAEALLAGRPRSRLARPHRTSAQRRRARAARVQARARTQRNAVLRESIQEAAQGVHGGIRRRHRARSRRHPRRREPGVGATCSATRARKRCSARRSWTCSTRGSQAALKGALVACGRGQWSGRARSRSWLRRPAATSCRSTSISKRRRSTATRPSSSACRVRAPKRASRRSSSSKPCTRIPTTGFYHRRRFLEVLTDRLDASSGGGVRALAYIRPDKFRELEEQIGPLASEDVLVQIAEQLASSRSRTISTAVSAAKSSRCSSSAARCATSRRGRKMRCTRIAGADFRERAQHVVGHLHDRSRRSWADAPRASTR